ncbi:MAG: hypothetical protein KY393_09045, partial [Actinobacteria bacterium]|nr:hypothetical protein [Actinomycetota bacterium]
GTMESFAKALAYAEDDNVLRHQYGVALSRAGRPDEAVAEFTRIIDSEQERTPPRATLAMALTTRIINLRRLNRPGDLRADVEFGRKLLSENPQLCRSSDKLVDLLDDFDLNQ